MRTISIICLAFLLAACQTTVTPNQTAAVTSDALLAMSKQVDLAEKRGWIDNETEDALINQLIQGQLLLQDVYTTGQVLGCSAEMDEQECLNSVLLSIEKILLEAEQ